MIYQSVGGDHSPHLSSHDGDAWRHLQDLVTTRALSTMLGLSRSAVAKLARRGRFGPYTKVGKQIIFERESFLAAIRERRIVPDFAVDGEKSEANPVGPVAEAGRRHHRDDSRSKPARQAGRRS